MRPPTPTAARSPTAAAIANSKVALGVALALGAAALAVACGQPAPAARPVAVAAATATAAAPLQHAEPPPRPQPRAPATAAAAGTSALGAPAVVGAAAAVVPRRHQWQLAWGSGAAALGRSQGPEQNPTAPQAIAADAAGGLWILDQDNARVVRLDGSQAVAALQRTTPLALDGAMDVALIEAPGGDGTTQVSALAILDRLVAGAVVVIAPDSGRERFRLEVRGDGGDARLPDAAPGPSGLGFGGGVTALTVYAGGLWVEWAHERSHRLGGVDGSRTGIGTVVPGRPTRAGELGLLAQAGASAVVWSAYDLRGPDPAAAPPRLHGTAHFDRPVFAVRALDSAADGRVWLAVHTLAEGAQGAILDERLEVRQYDPRGREALRDEALLEQGPHEQHRTFAAGADGSLWHLARRDAGAVIERWTR